jgi:hypothetical protein
MSTTTPGTVVKFTWSHHDMDIQRPRYCPGGAIDYCCRTTLRSSPIPRKSFLPINYTDHLLLCYPNTLFVVMQSYPLRRPHFIVDIIPEKHLRYRVHSSLTYFYYHWITIKHEPMSCLIIFTIIMLWLSYLIHLFSQSHYYRHTNLTMLWNYTLRC